MYLSSKSCFKLDEIIKSFEVAYRSFVVDILTQKFLTESDFFAAINDLANSYTSNSVMYSQKYASKIAQIQKESSKHYNTILACSNSLKTHIYDNDVPYVSDVIDYVSLFFNSCFQTTGIISSFNSVEEFQYLSKEYLTVRNSLSHPASSKVLIKEAQNVLTFMKNLLVFLPSIYFWYVPRADIENKIDSFILSVAKAPLKVHNLREIAFHQRKIVCRDAELRKLSDLIVGEKSPYYRVAGSVVVFGYGGVGKTALVIEFLYDLLRHLQDDEDYHPIDFILFFTSKEELLQYSKTTGSLYINQIRKQISSFTEFEAGLRSYLDVENAEQITKKYRGGIVVIDNLENLSQDDKVKIFEFIKRSPRQIQYIITSREEEPCEDKLHIREFKELEDGTNFIQAYIEENELNIVLDNNDCARLTKAAKGNTLILVLTLLSLHDRSNTLDGIISELEYVKARDVGVIADFMYKNTFEKALQELEKEGGDTKQLITLMSLYEEPIDLYSLSRLAKIDILKTENICSVLASKLVLDKTAEFYSINEFANNFIFIKLLPNELETNKIRNRIREYKQRITEQRLKLEEQKEKHPQIARIMQDWKPRNYVDERAIVEAFNLFEKLNDAIRHKDVPAAENVIKEISENELVTNHPYIKFQKARAYSRILTLLDSKEAKITTELIARSYEDAVQEIEFAYPYIKNTESYGALLWLYGSFLSMTQKDYSRSIRYLEEAKNVYSDIKGKNYFVILKRLSEGYKAMYDSTRDRAYQHKLNSVVSEVKRNRELSLCKAIRFVFFFFFFFVLFCFFFFF